MTKVSTTSKLFLNKTRGIDSPLIHVLQSLIFAFALLLLFVCCAADEVNLSYASLSLDNQEVGQTTGATITMARLDRMKDDPWAVFHCFELRINNPY